MTIEATPRPDLDATRMELEAAHAHLRLVIDAPSDDEYVNERILAAMVRLREAQARHAATRSGVPHLPDLIGWG